MRWVCWFTLLLPWVMAPYRQDAFWVPKEAVFAMGSWILILHTLCRPTTLLRRWSNPAMAWLGTWVVLSGGWHFWWPWINRSIHSTSVQQPFHIWLPTLHVVTTCVVVWVLVTHLLTTDYDRARLTHTVCLSAVLIAGYACIQYFNWDQFFGRHFVSTELPRYHMIAGFGNSNLVGTYLAMTCPLFLVFRERRYLVGLALVLATLGLIASSNGTKFPLLVGLVSLGVYGWLRWRTRRLPRWVWPVAGSVVGLVGIWGILTIGWPYLLADRRWPVWVEIIRMWQPAGMMGIGISGFVVRFAHLPVESLSPAMLALSRDSKWLTAHNDLLQAGLEWGLVGIGLVGWVIFHAFQSVWRRVATVEGAAWCAAGVACVLVSICNFPWHLAGTAWLCVIIWAMCEVTTGANA